MRARSALRPPPPLGRSSLRFTPSHSRSPCLLAQVIEARVLGLQHFLAMALASPQYMCPELVDFLEREKDMSAGPDFEFDATTVTALLGAAIAFQFFVLANL